MYSSKVQEDTRNWFKNIHRRQGDEEKLAQLKKRHTDRAFFEKCAGEIKRAMVKDAEDSKRFEKINSNLKRKSDFNGKVITAEDILRHCSIKKTDKIDNPTEETIDITKRVKDKKNSTIGLVLNQSNK
jgi:hypothetical protein